MAILNISNFSGLNYRSKKDSQEITDCSDSSNMVLNEKRELVGRNGTSEYDSEAGLQAHQSVRYGIDGKMLIYADESPATIFRLRPKIIDSNGERTVINGSGAEITVVENKFLFSNCEYDNELYLADTNEQLDIYKYDGGSIYRAGLSKGTILPDHVGTTTKFYRVFISFSDAQGKRHYSDFEQLEIEFDATNFIEFTNSDSGFFSLICSAAETKTLSGSNPTLLVDASCTYEVGQGVPFIDDDTGRNFIMYIDSIASNTITFSNPSLGISSVTSGDLVGCKYTIHVYESSSSSYGYTLTGSKEFQVEPLGFVQFTYSDISADPDSHIEDIYDDQTVKGLPPKCKYIDIHNNQMIAAGSFNSLDQYNKFYWSDLSVGSTVETFAPFDYENIGVTSEGEITGIKSFFGRIAVMKLRSIYLIDGQLFGRRFTVKNYFNNVVGCVSHFSIAKYGNGVIFVSEKGLYSITGNTLTELSDKVQPVFNGFSNIFLDVDMINERILFTYDGSIYVLDTYYNAFYKFDGLSTDCLIIAENNGKQCFLLTDHTNNRFTIEDYSSKNDISSAIENMYASAWISNGTPDLRKKYTELIARIFDNTGVTVDIETEYDWTDGNTGTQISKTSSEPIFTSNLDNDLVYSIRFIFKNSNVDESLKISSFSVEVEPTQQRPEVR